MKPGEYLLNEASGDIIINANRPVTTVLVKNTGDRPVQVGSHYHFFEVNTALTFERAQAYGKHLNIAAGTAVRFEPGEEKEVPLVPFAGEQVIHGHHGKVNGPLQASAPIDKQEH